MAAPTFDLQSHSTHSDGTLAPAEVVAAAAAAGVETLALTDHDVTSGVAEAAEAGRAVGLRIIPAVEMTVSAGERTDLHLLGYGIDPDDAALAAALAHSRGDRERRAERMSARLRELGWEVDVSTLDARRAAGKTIGRPHLAQAVVGDERNRERLSELGLLEMSDFLVAYLIPGAPAFSPREAPSVADGIALVHGAGGIAVWAHPFWDVTDPDEASAMLLGFREQGVDGVEAFYVTHTAEQTRLLAEVAAEHGLVTTGSSDFHGPDHARFDRFRAFSLYGLDAELGPLAG